MSLSWGYEKNRTPCSGLTEEPNVRWANFFRENPHNQLVRRLCVTVQRALRSGPDWHIPAFQTAVRPKTRFRQAGRTVQPKDRQAPYLPFAGSKMAA